MSKISWETYLNFKRNYFANERAQRFGQAFMNQFGYKERDLPNLFYLEDTELAIKRIESECVDWRS